MSSISVGSVCVKTAGREAGKKVVVVEKVDDNYVLVQGTKVKKRKCNILHLFPTGKTIDAKKITKEELAKIE
ncbi:MAG: 50S ribosomal protein L14e [archaeon]|nr:50S ribosomal protein L14e [archaeon]